MRLLICLALFLTAALPGFGQTAASAGPGLPSDPRAVFAAAAPFYDFTDAKLKPWHLKATYQFYDKKGKPTKQGTYEYWWASPQVYRSSWTRAGATHTDWHTADGKHAYQGTGEPLRFNEYKLQAALFSPLPDTRDLDPTKIRLDRETESAGGVKFPCIMVIPLMPSHGHFQIVPLGLFPTYCFNPHLPALWISYSFGRVTTQFNNIVKVQGRFLARDILLFEGTRKLLTATVDTIEGMAPSNSALSPPPNVQVSNVTRVNLSEAVSVGSLVKKQAPIYPQDAKDARVSGQVILDVTIGVDGGVHDLRVVSAPWPSLAASALWAVSHWEYKPFVVNGEPVEVETTVTATYTLGP